MTQSANPLRAFFRQPAIYMRLPSDGNFWPPGSLDMPVNRELPVLPMTAMDEITYRTPDALFNGAALVSVIQSCIPSIRDAWQMPYCDLNTILASIRIASYGKNMPINTECPSCKTQNEYELDLQQSLASIPEVDFGQTVNHGDLEIYFQPMSYQNQTDINLLQFEQQKLINTLPDSNLSEEEKSRRLADTIKNITEITMQAMCRSIQSIRTPQALVTEQEFILEFLRNCDRVLFGTIRNHIIKLRSTDEFKPVRLKCPECSNEYDQKFTLDTASFFETAS
jgi:DNA-directed RNA polymerase subunit M/transcription elongation factor TFIIS